MQPLHSQYPISTNYLWSLHDQHVLHLQYANFLYQRYMSLHIKFMVHTRPHSVIPPLSYEHRGRQLPLYSDSPDISPIENPTNALDDPMPQLGHCTLSINIRARVAEPGGSQSYPSCKTDQLISNICWSCPVCGQGCQESHQCTGFCEFCYSPY